jgi:hypothetical protein
MRTGSAISRVAVGDGDADVSSSPAASGAVGSAPLPGDEEEGEGDTSSDEDMPGLTNPADRHLAATHGVGIGAASAEGNTNATFFGVGGAVGGDEEELDLEDLDEVFDEDGTEEAAEFDTLLEHLGLPVGQYAALLGGGAQSGMGAGAGAAGVRFGSRTARPTPRSSSWDDGTLLKREFSAMVPPFDPRPDRVSVADSRNLTVPPPGSPSESFVQHNIEDARGLQGDTSKISLFLVDTELNGEERLRLLSSDTTIFRAVQQLSRNTKADSQISKIWEPVYTIVYRTARPEDHTADEHRYDPFFVDEALGTDALPKREIIRYLQKHGRPSWLKVWKLTGSTGAIAKSWNCRQLAAAYKDHVSLSSIRSSRLQFDGDLIGVDDLSRSIDVIRSLTPSPKKNSGPIGRLLQKLRRGGLPERGQVSVAVKESVMLALDTAVYSDRTGDVTNFLKHLGWGAAGKGVASPGSEASRPWGRLQLEAWDKVRGVLGEGIAYEEAAQDTADAQQQQQQQQHGKQQQEKPDSAGQLGAGSQADQILQLIARVYTISQMHGTEGKAVGKAVFTAAAGNSVVGGDDDDVRAMFWVDSAAFVSHKLNSKLRQQMRDPLVLARD